VSLPSSRGLALVRRVIFVVAASTGALLTLVLSLVGGALLHLDLPVTRRLAVKELNGILGTQFAGKVVIDRLAHLGVFGVRGVDATVTAADGTRVIVGKGVGARIAPLKIARSALFGHGDILIGVDSLVIDTVDVGLDTDVDGSLKLVKAFDPARPSPPSPPGSRRTAIDLGKISVKHVWAHGIATMAGAPPIDADLDTLEGSFLSTSAVTKLDVEHLTVLARGLPSGMRAKAEVEGHLAMPSPSGASMAVRGQVAGDVGEIPLTARVSMDGDMVDGVLDVPEVTAEKVRASIEGAPVYEKVSAHAEAHGNLANLGVALVAQLGGGRVTLDGLVHAKGALGGSVTLAASHLDARTFAKEGPATDLGIRVEAKAETRPDGLVLADASANVPEGTAAGQLVPPAALRLTATKRPGKDASPRPIEAHLEGVISEPGAPVFVTADGTFRDGASSVSFGVKADAPSLSKVKRLGSVGSGSMELTLSGRAEIEKEISFEAELIASAHGFDRPGAHVESVRVAAKAHGTPTNPELGALVIATGVAVSSYRFSRAELEVAGTPTRARVAMSAGGDRSPDVTLKGDVAVVPVLEVRGLEVGLKRHAEAVTIGVESFRLDGKALDAKGIVVTGAGAPLRASFQAAPGAISVTASSQGLDLAKLAYLAGQEKKAGGNLALDVDLDARQGHAKGKVALDLTKGEWSSLHGAEAHIGMGLDGRHLTGKVHADLGAVGSLDVSDMDVQVGGAGPLDRAAWKNAWGKMTLAANVDMARLAALAPPGSLHMADVAGRITLTGRLERESLSDTTPEIRVSLATVGLAATGESTPPVREPGGPLMVGPASWSLHGIDARVDLIIDGSDSAGELAVRVVDEQGVLVGVDLKTDPLPFKQLLGGDGDIVARLEKLPVSLLVDVPQRELGSLPLLIRPNGVRGKLAATLSMTGTALDPLMDLALTTQHLVVTAAPDAPMDGAVNAHYDGANARVNVSVRAPTGPLLSAEAHLQANAKDIVLARGLPAQWGGGVTAKLARFPLGAIGVLSDNQVKGFVSGDLEMAGLHDNAKAAVNLTLDELQMGKAKFTKAAIDGTLDDKGLSAKVRLEDPKGFLEADASMGMKWGNALVPVSDGTGLQAKLSAKHFSAAAVAPFASSALTELSGWVDANATVVLVPNQKPKMTGAVSLTDGIIQAPAIGEEFHAVKAKVTLNEDGLVRLEDVEARGLSGRLTASGSAHLDGTTLVSADLALDIRKADAIPLDIQGSNLGTVYGNVTVKAAGAPDGKALKVAIVVPHFHVDLPSGSLPRSPQVLSDAPSVHMGAYTSPDRFLVLTLDGAPVKLVAQRNTAVAPVLPAGGVGAPVLVEPPAGQAEAAKEGGPPPMELDATIHLGDVQVVRGQQVAINLDGDLTAKVLATTTVRGQIHLKSGKLNVQSKEFDIEKGTISFVGDDPSNPEVTVTAGWKAPDGTKVLADYVGPVKTGKVTLRSEPPRPKNEIVQLILFGTADGSEATPYASKSPTTGTQAGTAVGGLATDGLSKGLDQLTGMNVTTKVDTSDSSNPRADVELQIAKDISLQLAYVIVQPPPGDNPDLIYATIDWRFVRNWSLETTFGDAGSTFADMVWQYRY
jgi:translocation and assembly module TamB